MTFRVAVAWFNVTFRKLNVVLRKFVIVAVSLAVACSSGLGINSASASPGTGQEAKPSGDAPEPVEPGGPSADFLTRQAGLDKLADSVYAFTDPYETGRTASSYGDLTIDPASNRLDLWWKGPLPSQISERLAAAPAAVEVVLHDSRLSLSDMNVASDILLATLKTPVAGNQLVLDSIVPRVREGVLILRLRAASTSSQKAIESVLQAEISVPLKVEWLDDANVLHGQLGRQDDSSPWIGGGGIILNGGSYCTTGLPIKIDNSGNEYVTTGRHCILVDEADGNGYAASTGTVKTPANATIGPWKSQSSWNRSAYDTTLIGPSSGSVSPQVFSGSYSADVPRTITSVSDSTVGDYVCISGARSGSHCQDRIADKNVISSFRGAALGGNVTVQADSGIASAPGDSGGPVWYAANGQTYVKGTLIGGNNTVSCSGASLYNTATYGSSGCSSISTYASASGMLNAFGASIAPF